MTRAALSFPTFLSFLSFLAFMTGCSREPASPRSWLGAVTPVATPAAPGARFPNLASAADGQTVVMSWLEPGNEATLLRYSRLGTNGWDAPVTVARGADWFVNWADFPSVTALDDGSLAAHWLRKTGAGSYANGVALSFSRDL